MLTKQDLIDRLSAANDGLTQREAEHYIDSLTDMIATDLSTGGGVILRGFGRLYAAERKAGVGNNPRTGEKVVVAARRTARFKPGKALAERMNAG